MSSIKAPQVLYERDKLKLRNASTTEEALQEINAYLSKVEELKDSKKALISEIEQATQNAKTMREAIALMGAKSLKTMDTAAKEFDEKAEIFKGTLLKTASVNLNELAGVNAELLAFKSDAELFGKFPLIADTNVYGLYTYLYSQLEDYAYDRIRSADLENIIGADLENIIGYKLTLPFYERLDEAQLRAQGVTDPKQIDALQKEFRKKQKKDPFVRGLTRAQVKEMSDLGIISITDSTEDVLKAHRAIPLRGETLQIPKKSEGLTKLSQQRYGTTPSRSIASYAKEKALHEKMQYSGSRDELFFAAKGSLDHRSTFVLGQHGTLNLVVEMGFTQIDFEDRYQTVLQIRIWFKSQNKRSQVIIYNVTGNGLAWDQIKFNNDAITLIKGDSVADTEIRVASQSAGFKPTVNILDAQTLCDRIFNQIIANA